MSKLSDQLRTINIGNTYDLLQTFNGYVYRVPT